MEVNEKKVIERLTLWDRNREGGPSDIQKIAKAVMSE